MVIHRLRLLQSLPLWERGLKLSLRGGEDGGEVVAPLVGAWIEIALHDNVRIICGVAPLVGAWIEILIALIIASESASRSPCGSVD